MGKFVIKTSASGLRFNLKAGNGQVIATSQLYKTLATCRKGIISLQKNANSPVENQTEDNYAPVKNPKFEVYKDKAGEFRFRLRARNGQIVGTGEGYTTLAKCLNGIASIGKNAPGAEITME